MTMKLEKVDLKKSSRRSLLMSGIISSLSASLCCLTPLVIVLLGLGGISVALSFLRYRLYFLVLGFLFLGVATYIFLKRDYGKCNINAIKKEKSAIALSLILMIGIYVILTYFVIPPLLISNVEKILARNEATGDSVSELKVKINGMTCECNIADIQYNLMQINGILNASIDYASKIGTIKFDSAKTNQYAILKSEIFNGPYSAKLIN